MPEIISRKEAGYLGLRHYFTADPCGHGHIAQRYVCNKQCLGCAGVKDKPRNRLAQSGPAKDARMAGETRYFTGKPCVHGHISERMARTHECVECNRIKRRRQDKSPAGRARKRLKLQRRREEMRLLGLTIRGKPRRKVMLFSEEERKKRNRELKERQRVALRVLEELGIQI